MFPTFPFDQDDGLGQFAETARRIFEKLAPVAGAFYRCQRTEDRATAAMTALLARADLKKIDPRKIADQAYAIARAMDE